ncbi:MAG TPA: capsule assembly Wzi family protein [Acidobacteriaceae bacterium]|nr:capsule assembly Wzi family protein [Acidobacteriaceae bacterium]
MRTLAMLVFAALMLRHSYAQTHLHLPKEGSGDCDASNMASTYVPIESWIYPAIEKLALSGYIQTAFAGLRPWTRAESARLIAEAQEHQTDLDSHEEASEQANRLIRDLSREFAVELRQRDGECYPQAAIDSIDYRSTAIAGTPISDGYHFAQTLTNDYGRPYGEGSNLYTGLSARASSGPFAAYLHAELQQTAPGPATPSSADAAIAAADFTPSAQAGPVSGFTRGRVLEGYGSYTFHNNQFSFGNQALWWGPGKGGPLLFSNNAEPITMLRYDRVSPIELPGFGRWLGPIRMQFFVGRLSGQQFVHVGSQTLGQAGVNLGNQPFINGQNFSFKPRPDLEFSLSRTTIFAGAGAGFTTASFLRSLFSTSNPAPGKTDPGDRRVDVDVQFTVPKLHDLLKVYVDTFTDDELFPLAYPTHSAWSPGFYVVRLPHLPHVDFRGEGYLTPHRTFPGFYYFNVHYLSGYTNQRQLLGSWVGRESNGYQLWTNWWFSSRSTLQFSTRRQTANSEFLRGGDLRDINVTADLALSPHWQLDASVQQEQWRFPLLSAVTHQNVTTTIQLSFHPKAGDSDGYR